MRFAAVGLSFLVLFLHRLTDPDFQDPVTLSDWFATLGFSVALFALAAALPVFGWMFDELRIRRVSFVPSVGAALGGLSNVLEDGLQLDWAFWFFVLSSGLVVVGLLALSIAIALLGRGSDRLFAAIPAATLAGQLVFPVGGGLLMAAAWLGCALAQRRTRLRIRATT
jgi:MFS family permease